MQLTTADTPALNLARSNIISVISNKLMEAVTDDVAIVDAYDRAAKRIGTEAANRIREIPHDRFRQGSDTDRKNIQDTLEKIFKSHFQLLVREVYEQCWEHGMGREKLAFPRWEGGRV